MKELQSVRQALPGNEPRIMNTPPKKSNNKLLVIELDSETSVPKVFYEGKEIAGKIRIHFNWETKTDEDPGCLNFNVDYYEKDSNDHSIQKGIGLNR